jgi:hypothetical protein
MKIHEAFEKIIELRKAVLLFCHIEISKNIISLVVFLVPLESSCRVGLQPGYFIMLFYFELSSLKIQNQIRNSNSRKLGASFCYLWKALDK